jgi:hypothetical protein
MRQRLNLAEIVKQQLQVAQEQQAQHKQRYRGT